MSIVILIALMVGAIALVKMQSNSNKKGQVRLNSVVGLLAVLALTEWIYIGIGVVAVAVVVIIIVAVAKGKKKRTNNITKAKSVETEQNSAESQVVAVEEVEPATKQPVVVVEEDDEFVVDEEQPVEETESEQPVVVVEEVEDEQPVEETEQEVEQPQVVVVEEVEDDLPVVEYVEDEQPVDETVTEEVAEESPVAEETEEQVVEEVEEQVEPTVEVVEEEQPVEETVEEQPVVVVEEVVEEVEQPVVEETVVETEPVAQEVEQPQEVVVEETAHVVERTPLEIMPVVPKQTEPKTSNLPPRPKKEKAKQATNENDDTLIRYNKSFTAKVVLGEEELQERYSEIKNTLMSYEGVRTRMSWVNETFRYKRLPVAKLAVRGKTMTLYVALNPQDYVDAPYTVDDASDVKRYKDFPCAIKLKGPRVLKFAQTMVKTRLEQLETLKIEDYTDKDYRLPYRPFTQLLDEKFIKEIVVYQGTSGKKRLAQSSELLLKRVEVDEADELIEDEVAVTMVEKKHVKEVASAGKRDIVNIGTLTEHYNDGDVVNLESLKEKKLVARDTERVKILADGYLDKKLIVEAQDFSVQAIKMIVLTGGKAIEVD